MIWVQYNTETGLIVASNSVRVLDETLPLGVAQIGVAEGTDVTGKQLDLNTMQLIPLVIDTTKE